MSQAVDKLPIAESPERTEKPPEIQLLSAILCRAIRDYVGSEPVPKRDAEVWLFCSRKTDEFSFLWICQELDLSPETLRRVIEESDDGRLMELLT